MVGHGETKACHDSSRRASTLQARTNDLELFKYDAQIEKKPPNSTEISVSESRVNSESKVKECMYKTNISGKLSATSQGKLSNTNQNLNSNQESNLVAEHSACDSKSDDTNKLLSRHNSKELTVNNTLSTVEIPWTEVVRRNKAKRQEVVGKKTLETNSRLRGVPKSISLHVYRLAPDTKIDEIVEYLKPTLPVLACEQLQSRNPLIYSSFKIDISDENLEVALNPDTWPDNACVRRFFSQSRKQLKKT